VQQVCSAGAKREDNAVTITTTRNRLSRFQPGFSLVTIIVLSLPAAVLGDDFCVENRVYVGADIVESKTLFQSGRVYDFLVSPNEVTIFDPSGKRFVVLDPDRKVKAEVSLEKIDSFAKTLKAEAVSRHVPLLMFLAEPKFTESIDDTSGELKLTSAWLEYRVRTSRPPSPEAAIQYANYSNWQTKFNALLRPGSLPPFARLELNAALERRDSIPSEVNVTRFSQQSAKRQVTFRSEHRLQWRLLDGDRKQIERAAQQLAEFHLVNLAEYQRPLLKADAE
jgi:hypothetical protein